MPKPTKVELERENSQLIYRVGELKEEVASQQAVIDDQATSIEVLQSDLRYEQIKLANLIKKEDKNEEKILRLGREIRDLKEFIDSGKQGKRIAKLEKLIVDTMIERSS